jgi:hypothetical protein
MKQHYWAEVPKTAADENDKLPIRWMFSNGFKMLGS